MALSEIVGIIEDVLSSTEESPVFVLKDLVKMYKEIPLDLGANEEFIRKVHSKRLKESIMKHVSCLYEKKKGKDVLLTLEEHVGYGIFEASKTSSFDEGIKRPKSYVITFSVQTKYSMEIFHSRNKQHPYQKAYSSHEPDFGGDVTTSTSFGKNPCHSSKSLLAYPI